MLWCFSCFPGFSWTWIYLNKLNWEDGKFLLWCLPVNELKKSMLTYLKFGFSFDTIIDDSNGKPVNTVLKSSYKNFWQEYFRSQTCKSRKFRVKLQCKEIFEYISKELLSFSGWRQEREWYNCIFLRLNRLTFLDDQLYSCWHMKWFWGRVILGITSIPAIRYV